MMRQHFRPASGRRMLKAMSLTLPPLPADWKERVARLVAALDSSQPDDRALDEFLEQLDYADDPLPSDKRQNDDRPLPPLA